MYHRIGKNGTRYWGKKGAGILFTDGESLLLLRRAEGSDHAGTWGLPGGKAKSGETAIDTAKRECKEEIGSHPGVNLGSFDDTDHQHKFTVFMFKVKSPFDVELSHEHDDSKWANIDKLEKMNLHPRFKENLDRYKKAINTKFKSLKTFSEWVSFQESL